MNFFHTRAAAHDWASNYSWSIDPVAGKVTSYRFTIVEVDGMFRVDFDHNEPEGV